MKAKEGRDYVELSETVASVKDGNVHISDAGATLILTKGDWERLKRFVDASTRSKHENHHRTGA